METFKFEEASSYQVMDVDGELAGFTYDHPLTDPISGATLDNTISVNGVALPHGFRSSLPACNDLLDNDRDGLVDLADRGCPLDPLGIFSDLEDPQCDDGLDNDGDGRTDFADPNCEGSVWPYWESFPRRCGLGGEVALLIAPLLLMRRRLRLR